MDAKQKFTIYILSFVLLFSTMIGGYIYGILEAPAATSSFNIEGNFKVDSQTGLQTLSINKVSGSINSKIIDIILLLLKVDQK
jgi:hypothetical protein